MFHIKIPFVIATHLKSFDSTASLVNKNKAKAVGVVAGVPYFHDGTAVRELGQLRGAAPISITGATVTLGATHVGRPVVLNRAAGIAATLPAATGSGDTYTLIVGTTFTGAATVAVPNATDYFVGTAILFQDAGDATVSFATANTGTVSTESDTMSMFGTANSQGGFKGAKAVFIDIASAVWSVAYVSDAGGTEATPFSAAV